MKEKISVLLTRAKWDLIDRLDRSLMRIARRAFELARGLQIASPRINYLRLLP